MGENLPDSVFVEDNGYLLPTDLAKGPWYPGTQHGSSMMGLMAWGVEQHDSDIPRQVVRLTVDMMKALPMAAVEIKSTTHNKGRYVEVVDVSLWSEGKEYVRGSALRFRTDDVPLSPGYDSQEQITLPSKPQRSIFANVSVGIGFHSAFEYRTDFAHEQTALWLRLTRPLVAGFEITPFQRVAVAADWTYSVPNIRLSFTEGKGFEDHAFVGINPDTTINLHQPLQGEWVGLKSRVSYGGVGAGTVSAQLFGEQGAAVGFSSQSVLLRRNKLNSPG